MTSLVSLTVRVVDDSEVIYVPRRTRVIYRDPVDDFWLPLTLGVGIGWITSGHSHGGWHGHGRSHRGWRH